MPHVIVKLWPGKSEAQKRRLAEPITQAVIAVLNYGEEMSVAFEGIRAKDWKEKVYEPDILSQPSGMGAFSEMEGDYAAYRPRAGRAVPKKRKGVNLSDLAPSFVLWQAAGPI